MENITIIGIVGYPASGKDTVADYIASKGYVNISTGDFIRKEMKKVGIETNRDNMINFVTEMRKKFGDGYPTTEIIKNIHSDTVISGFRNTEEVKTMRRNFKNEFKVIAVESPIEMRYLWAKQRGRIGDEISFDEFTLEEAKEKSSITSKLDTDKVIEMADIKIINDAMKEDLFVKVDDYLARLKF